MKKMMILMFIVSFSFMMGCDKTGSEPAASDKAAVQSAGGGEQAPASAGMTQPLGKASEEKKMESSDKPAEVKMAKKAGLSGVPSQTANDGNAAMPTAAKVDPFSGGGQGGGLGVAKGSGQGEGYATGLGGTGGGSGAIGSVSGTTTTAAAGKDMKPGYAPPTASDPGKPPAEQPKTITPPTDTATKEVPDKEKLEKAGYTTHYISNDDAKSITSCERIKLLIEKKQFINPNEVRPHECINYYTFAIPGTVDKEPLLVVPLAALDESATGPSDERPILLGVGLKTKSISKDERRNIVLTVVLDRSGSMSSAGKIDYTWYALEILVKNSLKPGDVLTIVDFDTEVEVALEAWSFSDAEIDQTIAKIKGIKPRGGTNLKLGLDKGYELAWKYFDKTKANRVILMTDAMANVGVTSVKAIAQATKNQEMEGIILSGIGVGQEFNDKMLDEVTEAGKGTNVFLSSKSEAERLFGEEFIGMVEIEAEDVQVALKLPPSIGIKEFFGEEISTEPAKVKRFNVGFNESSLILQSFLQKSDTALSDPIYIEYNYTDHLTGQEIKGTITFTLDDLLKKEGSLVKKAFAIHSYADSIKKAGEEKGKGNVQAGKDLLNKAMKTMKAANETLGDPDLDETIKLLGSYLEYF